MVGVPHPGGFRDVLETAGIVLASRWKHVGRVGRLVAGYEVEVVVHGLRGSEEVGLWLWLWLGVGLGVLLLCFPRPVREVEVVVVGPGHELLPSSSLRRAQRLAVPAVLGSLRPECLAVRVASAAELVVPVALAVLVLLLLLLLLVLLLVLPGGLAVGAGVRVRVRAGVGLVDVLLRVIAANRQALTHVAVPIRILPTRPGHPPPLLLLPLVLRRPHAAPLGHHAHHLQMLEALQRGLLTGPPAG